MTFVLRPFDQCVEAFRASSPDEELREQSPPEHYDALAAFSFANLKQWPTRPPLTSLYRMRDPLVHSGEVLNDPQRLVAYSNHGTAVGTWNANGTGQWAHEPGAWIVADVELVQEQVDEDDFYDEEGSGGDYVNVIFALWKVEDGWAAAVWRSGERDTLAKVMGFDAWPTAGWEPCKVWYGEGA